MLRYIQKYLVALALIATFVVLAAAWFFLKRLPGAIRSLLAKSWPLTDGRIETVNVRTIGEQALAGLGYSYLAEGMRYSGYYSQQFVDEQQAWDYAGKLQGRSVMVRHKHSNPGVSVLRVEDQQPCPDFKSGSLLSTVWTAFLSAIRELYASWVSEQR